MVADRLHVRSLICGSRLCAARLTGVPHDRATAGMVDIGRRRPATAVRVVPLVTVAGVHRRTVVEAVGTPMVVAEADITAAEVVVGTPAEVAVIPVAEVAAIPVEAIARVRDKQYMITTSTASCCR